MDAGIGLPNALLDVRGPELVDWARRAENAGFSVLGTIGRVVYPNHEELVALAAAAGATTRINLMTSVLVAPPRQAVLLAKQAATLDAVSGGRFRLGLGIGGRDDDWQVLGVEPRNRGGRLETLITACRSVWAGDTPDGAESPVGPPPTDLPIVLGGYSEPAWERAGRLADAFIAGPMPPDAVAHAYQIVKESAATAGRATPRLYAARYVALGDDAAAEADRNVESYYGFGGQELVGTVRNSVLSSASQLRETADALAEAGTEEVCFWPASAQPDQVDRVAEAALG
ncbi:LLM class flavin-dependent oxidoreductase [Phytoactinopolyspora halotolerans]|uniref:LLM class flavin-dependent oxidoreductase n=1 Tax=Phytoactinopolyspora halotolerans TaxID=1981512 RepID=A0A6L9SGH0_9ACTN|nr:LLM class flavin-dependent oxidoreductase [Phytoactinopolyspora halotolerans]NEE04356.1 LLM class flavin-dependent oxidoreductase [Phytoactinopolyspora halotolerans]